MRCERCGDREAVVHLHQVAGGEVTKLHLCDRCAAEQGIATVEPAGTTPIGQLVAALGKVVSVGQSLLDVRRLLWRHRGKFSHFILRLEKFAKPPQAHFPCGRTTERAA